RHHRAKDREGADRTDEEDLTDGERRDQPLAHGVVEREHEIAAEHQEDAEQDLVCGVAKRVHGLRCEEKRLVAAFPCAGEGQTRIVLGHFRRRMEPRRYADGWRQSMTTTPPPTKPST